MGGVMNRFQIFILVILLYWFNLIDIYEAIAIIEYINDIGLKSMKFSVLTVFGLEIKSEMSIIL